MLCDRAKEICRGGGTSKTVEPLGGLRRAIIVSYPPDTRSTLRICAKMPGRQPYGGRAVGVRWGHHG